MADFNDLAARYARWQQARDEQGPTAAQLDAAIQDAWELRDLLQDVADQIEAEIERTVDRHYDMLYTSGGTPDA